MKNFLQNSLIFLALCLCALVAFQWHREAGLRRDVQSLNNTIHDKLEAIQNLQGRLKQTEEEVKRLDELKRQGFEGNVSIEYEYEMEHSLPLITQCVEFIKKYGGETK